MFKTVRPFLLHAITSVHAGSGSEIGLVDLPIQREKHTGFPKIESSSLKGAIRYDNEVKRKKENKPDEVKKFELVFGSKPKNENDNKTNETQSSAIALSDARILLFPVKSMRGVFAWVTCPFVLKRFNDEMAYYDKEIVLPVPESNTVSSERLYVSNGQIVLEEYTFPVSKQSQTEELADKLALLFKDKLSINITERLVVLDDDDFADFVKLSTEVNARIKINTETGTVSDGALWYEENVPPETIFYSLLFIGDVRGDGIESMKTFKDVERYLIEEGNFPEVFQLGGNGTLGRGMFRRIWM
ncbi:type III-B CRISPR module RAMP protein Cmr4 [Caenibacillus caldisaponilyticus]|uniref:type III-B CRISPR module RAMP protein Cmr4 n=1 Tax=Caenibacillus caldisaponilyticus TaxID=1674942 RepID=UPI0009883A5C|nr:type III-B CRISPR module RAMP protein Cmr4 [Caenibacillus caldisaponilyticus]